MESKLLFLLRADIMGRLGWNTLRFEKDSGKRRKAMGLAAVMVFIGMVMAGYAFGLSFGLGFLGMAELIPGYAMTITSIITIAFTFLKTNGVLFGSRDYDMLMAFPLRTTTVITAKFLSMYLSNLCFACLVMLPMAVGYCIWMPFGSGTVLFWMLGILLTPLLPMTLAAMVGAVIAAIGSGFRYKVFVQMILSVVLVVGIIAVSFQVQESALRDEEAFLLQIADMGAVLSDAIHGVYPLSAWFDRAMVNGDLAAFLLFAGVSLLTYATFALICGKYYGRINTALTSWHAASNYQLGELKAGNVWTALVKREAKRFTSSSIYMLNMGMGLVMALMLAVACLVVGVDKTMEGIGISDIASLKRMLVNLMPFFIAMLVNMTCTTAVSLSLEGRNLWVVQSLPIERRTLLQGKMLFNIILVLPVSLICSIIFIFALDVSFLPALCYLLFSVVSVLFSTVLGTWINLHFPNYTWQNEVEVIKQSAGSMLGILGSMLGYLIMAAGAFALNGVLSGELVLVMFSLLLGILTAIIYHLCRESNSYERN